MHPRRLPAIASLCLFVWTVPADAGERVWATWYGPGFHGRMAASGVRFNQHAMTFAHRSMPFGTRVKFCFRRCKIGTATDRGPFGGKARYDLARGLADAIGMTHAGIALITAHRVR